MREWFGQQALDMAITPGRLGGPAFERIWIKEWRELCGSVQAMRLTLQFDDECSDWPANFPRNTAWWRMWSGDSPIGSRFIAAGQVRRWLSPPVDNASAAA